MAITASSITSSATLEEFRIQFNNLVTDVSAIQDKNVFTTAIIFEGATADAYETTLTVVDPTADRTITLPNETGTVLTDSSTISVSAITISANNSTDETVYPVFVDGATGSQGLETDTGLTYNPSTGVLGMGGFTLGDDTYSYYGADSDIKVGYDDTTNNALVFGANVEGAALNLHLYADQGDDNADHWLWSIADAGNITWQSKTGGSFATKLTLTPAGNMTVAGNLTGSGTTTTIDSTVTTIVDPLIVLQAATGGGSLGSDTNKDVGLAMQYYSDSAKTAFLGYDDSAGALTFITDATISSEVVSGTAGEMIVGDISANNGIVADTFGTIILSGTNAASANAGSDLTLDSSAASTNVGERLVFESGTVSLHADPGHESGTFVTADKVLLNSGAGIAAGDSVQSEDGEGGILFEDATSDMLLGAVGRQTVWVPSAAMRPTSTNGAAAIATSESTAPRPDMNTLDFESSTQEYAQYSIGMPNGWDKGTLTASFYFTHATAVSTNVVWGIQCVAVSDNDTIDVTFGPAQTVVDTLHNTAEDLQISAETNPITVKGSPAAGDLVFFQVFRDADDAADTTNSTDALLVGVKMFFYTNDINDS